MKALLAFALSVAVTLALASAASANELSDSDIFTIGGTLYEEGNYEEAARTYQHLVDLGHQDPTLYYNLANAHYKSGDMGRAVLNYLRARRLAPFDEDIAANLSFARQQSDAPNSEQATTPAFVQIAEFVPWITFNQAAIVALGAWLLLGLLAALFLYGGRFRRSMAVSRLAAVAILCVFVFGSIAIGKHTERIHWEGIAVVTSDSTGVFHGPRESDEPRFSLDAGSEVRLTEARGRWSKIGIFDSGVEGWIESTRAESVLEPRG